MTTGLLPAPRRAGGGPERPSPSRRQALRLLVGVSAALVVASPLLHVLAWRQQVADPGSEPAVLFLLVDTNGEQNLPAWWSASLLLLAAGLAGLRSLLSRGATTGLSRGWAGLAGLLALLSLDEVASLHERVLGALGEAAVGGASGLLHFAWVVPGLAVAAALALAAVPFLRALDGADRRCLTACGCGYAIAVLGVEAVSGAVLDSGVTHAAYLLVTAAEEALEMGAVIALLAGLSRGLRLRTGEGTLAVSLAPADPARRPGVPAATGRHGTAPAGGTGLP